MADPQPPAVPTDSGPTPTAKEMAAAYGRYGPGKHKRRRSHKMPGEEITELNLTAMMDMMTILLVFLVKSFATDPAKIQISDTMRPPESSSKVMLDPAVTITVTTTAVLVEDKEILQLSSLDPKKSTPKDYDPVLTALNAQVDKLKDLERRGSTPFDGKVLIVAHKTTPYDIITNVLYTAGQAEFSQYRLVVMQGTEEGAPAR